ncbi:hypothetical protein OC842_004731 [Tilletia horrida]|uniref:Peptide N-acetyl-beta-D-glucosaminyl asparaginase amidase A N-terminal domain-containing protein n=1 Tax=Tilletia horrida TaxID=155126 RepID=A0AAN6G932_9BASI|nr:hypothetical protein OC842_004731 [Tilletia horrida]
MLAIIQTAWVAALLLLPSPSPTLASHSHHNTPIHRRASLLQSKIGPVRVITSRRPHNLVLADLVDDSLSPSAPSPSGAKTAASPSSTPSAIKPKPLHNFEVNVPPRVLPDIQDLTSCTIDLITRSFANSYGNPSAFPYSPALFPAKCADANQWTAIVLTQQGASIGRQFDRLGSIAIGNNASNGPVEIWRTDNAEPTLTGVTWSTRKDVSQYFSLFKQPDSTMVFDYPNIVDDTYTGALNLTLSMTVYQAKTKTSAAAAAASSSHANAAAKYKQAQLHLHAPRRSSPSKPDLHLDLDLGLTPSPLSQRTPDAIFALSGSNKALTQPALSLVGGGVTASPSTAQLSTSLSSFPINAARALVEIYASGTSQDEFWYSNVPSQLAEQVPNAADLGLFGGGPYREVQLYIDNVLAGIVSPYAVIFTGGIQPLMWRPEAAFGAYNQPTYLIDITPFIGTLTDGKSHTFRLAVQSADRNGSFPQGWFLSGNVQVVLDASTQRTTGRLLSTPPRSAWLPYPTLTTTGHIKGNLSTPSGSLTATVRTGATGAGRGGRNISVVGEVQTGSMRAAARYTWSQSLTYRSDLNINATVSISKQKASGKSVLTTTTTSSSSLNGESPSSFPLYAHAFSFPLSTTSAYDGAYLNGSAQHTYETSLAALDSLLGPWLGSGSGAQGGKKLGLPLAQSVSTTQEAEAYSAFSGSGVVGGVGKTSQTYSYSDSDLYTFDRSTSVFNRTVTSDKVSGTLASQADRVN